MIIYPNLYNKFECIGSACQNTCCTGWGIPLDSDTTNYYQHLDTDFGTFLRNNTYEEKGQTQIRLTEDGRCPFLDHNGLCQVYQKCGPEHMSNTCQNFPRRSFIMGEHILRGLSLSCEAVLQLLQDDADPLQLSYEGTWNRKNKEAVIVYDITQYIAWGMKLLQDPTVPLGTALGTVLYIGMETEAHLKDQDYTNIENLLLREEVIQKEFELAKKNIKADELADSAWQLILQVTDIFCEVISRSNLPQKQLVLWSEKTALLSDGDKLQYIKKCYTTYRSQLNEKQHLHFMRRLAALFFCTHTMGIMFQDSEQLFLQDVCNFILLTEIVPAACSASKFTEKNTFYPGTVTLSRFFDQTQLISQCVWPMIKQLLSPDIITYTITFMYLFDEPATK